MPLVRLTEETQFGKRSYRQSRMECDVVFSLAKELESVGPSILPFKSVKSPVTTAMTLRDSCI